MTRDDRASLVLTRATAIDPQPRTTGTWRWIVELSCMSNNDEVVIHAGCDVSSEDFKLSDECSRLSGSFRDPVLVLSRPVFEAEVKAGLDVSYSGDRFAEARPEVTTVLDGLHRLLRDVECRLKYWGEASRNATDVLVDVVAYSYYDCMSGGMDSVCGASSSGAAAT